MASGPMPMEDTPTPMEPTTSASVRPRLRLSPRLMPLFCMLALMATLTPMVPTPMATGPMPMERTPMLMEPTTSASVRPRLRPSPRLMPLFYGAYGYPYTYGAYPYGYRSYAYGAYPYAYGAHYIGKREAEAEAKPEADAALLYGAYGYPYTYGAYPYGYRSYAYGAYPY